MNTFTESKQELIDWIKQVDNEETLEQFKILKENSQPVKWDNLPEEAKAGIKRGEKDFKAGRTYSSNEFWKQIRKWRNKQNV